MAKDLDRLLAIKRQDQHQSGFLARADARKAVVWARRMIEAGADVTSGAEPETNVVRRWSVWETIEQAFTKGRLADHQRLNGGRDFRSSAGGGTRTHIGRTHQILSLAPVPIRLRPRISCVWGLVGRPGIEPGTLGLRGPCSAS